MAFRLRLTLLGALLLMAWSPAAHAITLRFSAASLERTLNKNLFTAPGGRYYLRGSEKDACYVYAEQPHITFAGDRVDVAVITHAKLGGVLRKACLGVSLNTSSVVSVLPQAEGESIGFRDAKIEHLTDSSELNFLLGPFLSRKLPQELKINAKDLIRSVLANSMQSTGYDLRLDSLTIHSMHIEGDAMVVDVDGDMSVR